MMIHKSKLMRKVIILPKIFSTINFFKLKLLHHGTFLKKNQLIFKISNLISISYQIVQPRISKKYSILVNQTQIQPYKTKIPQKSSILLLKTNFVKKKILNILTLKFKWAVLSKFGIKIFFIFINSKKKLVKEHLAMFTNAFKKELDK